VDKRDVYWTERSPGFQVPERLEAGSCLVTNPGEDVQEDVDIPIPLGTENAGLGALGILNAPSSVVWGLGGRPSVEGGPVEEEVGEGGVKGGESSNCLFKRAKASSKDALDDESVVSSESSEGGEVGGGVAEPPRSVE